MIYHIVTGDVAAAPLSEAIASEESMAGEVVMIKDVLSIGPLQKEEGQKFSELRSAFWQQVAVNDKNPIQVDDMERLLEVSAALAKNEDAKVWVWMAPWPADVATYHWTIKYLGKYPGRFFVVNIAGLPFLDPNGKLFYPKSLGEIAPKELVKARRLARPVTPAEVETDGEEWRKLTVDNAGIRTHEGGKRLTSRSEDHFDSQLTSFCSHQFQKGSKIVGQALMKFNIPTGDLYLGWRLRKLAEAGKLQLQGDANKSLKDFDVKLPGTGTSETVGVP
ncbi:MAG: DUF3658 domain-containing protein [Bacteroidota bacterium]